MADVADLGEFRREHRLYNDVSGCGAWLIGGLVPFAVLILGLNGQWLAILIIVALVVPAVLSYQYLPMFAPAYVSTLADPARIAVYQRGLVLDGGREPARAVRWEQVTQAGPALPGSPPARACRVSYQCPGTFSGSFTIGRLTGRGTLLAAVTRRGAAPVRRWPRAAGAGLAAVAIALYTWLLVVPQVDPGPPPLPFSSFGLDGACHAGAVGYRNAAAYAGGARHPVIVFYRDTGAPADPFAVTPSADTSAPFSAQWLPGDPGIIQLVACVTPGVNTRASGVSCSYSKYGIDQSGPLGNLAGPTETVHVSLVEYQITVYTLRTHRELGATVVTGTDMRCPTDKEVGAPVYSQLTDAELHQVLDPYVNRPA
jgi:hypothetical protein